MCTYTYTHIYGVGYKIRHTTGYINKNKIKERDGSLIKKNKQLYIETPSDGVIFTLSTQ